MRPQVVTQTGIGSTAAVPLDYNQPNFKVGFGVVVSGTVNYTVQHTFDDPASSPTWFDHDAVASQAANADGNYAFPVRAIRITVSSGTGTATGTFLQAS